MAGIATLILTLNCIINHKKVKYIFQVFALARKQVNAN